MSAPEHEQNREMLWIALGNQPGVSAWFSVWMLARELRTPAATATESRRKSDTCTGQTHGSPA